MKTINSFRLEQQFYKNIEARIWSEIFPKTRKNSEFEHAKFSNQKLRPI